MNKYLAIDVDDVVLDLVPEWIKYYNAHCCEKIEYVNIKLWNLEEVVRCERHLKLIDMIRHEDLYKFIQPVPGAVEGLSTLRSLGFKIVFATNCTPTNMKPKYDALVKFGAFVDGDEYVPIKTKALLNTYALVDDNAETIKTFPNLGILYSRPWNVGEIMHGTKHWFAPSWADVVNIIKAN